MVRAAQDGDQQALDTLVADYLPLIYNIVGRALAAHAETDDVVQEVMLQMIRDLRKLRDPDAFGLGWSRSRCGRSAGTGEYGEARR
ncbi:MAG: putative polymerase ECF-subfamily sigma factor [Amycolatopsis sp.]|nr:putative polymerase ECF-subfamily sigma factor [Amycolatopsis sp.]